METGCHDDAVERGGAIECIPIDLKALEEELIRDLTREYATISLEEHRRVRGRSFPVRISAARLLDFKLVDDPDNPQPHACALGTALAGACEINGGRRRRDHALFEYLAWKRLSAAKSYVQTLVTLISCHLLSRGGTFPAEQLN
jgi:hypothetical protein